MIYSLFDRLSKWLLHLLLIVLTIVWVFPFFWGVTGSFKTERDMFASPPVFFPKYFMMDNYIDLFSKTEVPRWMMNSFIVSLSTMALVCLFSSMAGYAFSKLRFRGRDFIFFFMISLMMIPHYIMLVPLFRMMKELNWLDTYIGLVVPQAAVPFGVFLMRQFIQTIPQELMESARLDGCNEFMTFRRIIVPLTGPAIAALAIFTFVHSWNDYVWQLLTISSESMLTLPLGVATLQQELNVHYGQLMAGSTLSALPMIVIFIIFQKYFTRGITLGSVKG